MSPILLHSALTSTRTIELRQRAVDHRQRKIARAVRSRSGWRERIGWQLVEVGLALVATEPPRQPACY